MKILFWCDTIWPMIGGVEVLAEQFLRDLAGRGHEVLVLTNRDFDNLPTEETFHGIRIRRLDFRRTIEANDIFAITRLRQEVAALKREFQPDLVHMFHAGPSTFFHLTTSDASPAPCIATAHMYFLNLEPESMARRCLEEADWVTGCSVSVIEDTIAQIPSLARRATGIPNGPEVPALPPSSPPNQQKLLCIGRIVWDKGFDVALAAVFILRDRYPDLRLTIAGDGVYREDLEANAKRLGLDDIVTFLGWVQPEDVPALMSDHDIVVMPSHKEPFGIVAVQAAYMERPLVGARAGGLLEVVIDGETGLLANPLDPEDTAEKIAMLLDDPELAARLGKAARPHVMAAFNWDLFMSRYDALYEQVAAMRKGGSA